MNPNDDTNYFSHKTSGIPTRLLNLSSTHRPRSQIQEGGTAMGPGYQKKDSDVICGTKGLKESTIKHPGNERYKEIIQARIERYMQAVKDDSRSAKSQVVKEIVDIVRASGGNFIRQMEDPEEGGNTYWYDIGNIKAREKTGCTIRAMLSKGDQQSRQGRRRTSSMSSQAKAELKRNVSMVDAPQFQGGAAQHQQQHHLYHREGFASMPSTTSSRATSLTMSTGSSGFMEQDFGVIPTRFNALQSATNPPRQEEKQEYLVQYPVLDYGSQLGLDDALHTFDYGFQEDVLPDIPETEDTAP